MAGSRPSSTDQAEYSHSVGVESEYLAVSGLVAVRMDCEALSRTLQNTRSVWFTLIVE